MADKPERELLERATRAIERQEKTSARQEKAFQRLMRRMDERDALAEARHQELLEGHERLMRRLERSERVFISALTDIDASIQRSVARLDDMGDAIRANTRAVLSVLDQLGPGTAPS
jgi:hypothetical protein